MKATIYELSYLISGQIEENQAQNLAKKIEEKLEKNSVILSSTEPKKIKLAYTIKKQQDGYLVSVDFTSEPANLVGISKEMEKEADVLRFLTIKKSPEKQEEERKEQAIKKPVEAEQEIAEEKQKTSSAPIVKEKKKKEKPVGKERKEEDLKKIEKDLDEILGIPDEDEPKAKFKE